MADVTDFFDVTLDCNCFIDAIEHFGCIPTDEDLAKTYLGRILKGIQLGRKVDGKRVRLVVSFHIWTTVDYVSARNGWSAPGQAHAWLAQIIKSLYDLNAVVIENVVEDRPGLIARAARHDGAEDWEDEAVMRCVEKYHTALVTNDRDLAECAGFRNVNVIGGREFARRMPI